MLDPTMPKPRDNPQDPVRFPPSHGQPREVHIEKNYQGQSQHPSMVGDTRHGTMVQDYGPDQRGREQQRAEPDVHGNHGDMEYRMAVDYEELNRRSNQRIATLESNGQYKGMERDPLQQAVEKSRLEKLSMEATLGSKDMDYRDRRMGDPRDKYKSPPPKEPTKTVFPSQLPSEFNPCFQLKDIGYIGLSMHRRFSKLENFPDPKVKELIQIGIERNILGGEPAVISKIVKLNEVIMPRRKGEGEKLLHLREEFVTREEEYEERRVIKVLKTEPTR
jgi:hypothetical protein